MEPVQVAARSIDTYRTYAGDEAIDELRGAAEPLRGLRVLHVNATPDGGGVAEILQSAVPLLRDLGLDCEWRIFDAPAAFFEVSKAMHNRLQGGDGVLTLAEQQLWTEWQDRNATALSDDFDVIVVHDPQPSGLAARCNGRCSSSWIWRLHIDSSNPRREVWDFLRPNLDAYAALVFTLPEFVPSGLPSERVRFMAPAIDPMTAKNRPIPLVRAQQRVTDLGIDLTRPLIAQVSRLDPWKDPTGVIDVYRKVRERHPGLQLALVGAMEADDDPEAASVADDVRAHADGDPDIHVYTDPAQIGPEEVGSVQLLADVILQKSLREGFGLTVAEAMWKATPVVGARAGGIPLQLADCKGGFLVDSIDEAAERSDWLLSHPAAARQIGAAGREVVQSGFLTTRLLAEELTLYREAMVAVPV
jgi:trehalose synthase